MTDVTESDTLIYFTGGGPLDGRAWRQSEIFGREQMMAGADQYEDTATFKTSEKTGARARVWRLKEPNLSPSPQPVRADADERVRTARLDLLARRETLKAARALVAERAGLASSKVAAIENGTGKRIKPEEVTALEDTLAALEQEAAARAHG